MGKGRNSPVPEISEYFGHRPDLRTRPTCAWDDWDSYLAGGRVLVARTGDEVIAHLHLQDTDEPGVFEIGRIEVRTEDQDRGIDTKLIAAAIDLAAASAGTKVVVGVPTLGTERLRFYQQLGFRMASIERNAYTLGSESMPAAQIDGIDFRDRVWLDYDLTQAAPDDPPQPETADAQLNSVQDGG